MEERASIQRFLIRAQVGSGGMGTVYRAFDPQLEREVAIKVLNAPDDRIRDELSTERTLDLRDNGPTTSASAMLQEARMMARLSHPNVVPVYEVGLDGTAVFVVMEHVGGTDLRTLLEAPHETAEILGLFAQAGRGLAAAHARNIVHRDFKPDNVLVGSDGRVRVGDFGLSRLNAPTTSLVRVAEVGGTPRYMAPELWKGGLATPAADVYAFCIAVVEALGAEPTTSAADREKALRTKGISPRLRALLATGLDEQADRRPPIERLVDGLEGRTPHRRLLAIAAGTIVVGAASLGVAMAFATTSAANSTCADDPALLAGQWEPSMRASLKTALTKSRTGPTGPERAADLERVLTAFDGRATALTTHRRTICQAQARGELTAMQATQRTACVERRALELGAVTRSVITAERPDINDAEERLHPIVATTCDELEVPPPPGDRAALGTLYNRFAGIAGLPHADAIKEAEAVEREAAAQGDTELEVRAAILGGVRLRLLDKIPESLVVLERAHKTAVLIKSPMQTVQALAERSASESIASNFQAAASLAQLARDLAGAPGMPMNSRLKVFRTLGRAQLLRGEYATAVETTRAGLDLLFASGERHGTMEILIRLDLIDALLRSEGRESEALALALETEARAKLLLGEHGLNTAIAINQVAKAYTHQSQLVEALPYRRAALAIVASTLPADHSQVVHQRGELAQTLHHLNQVEEARRELEKVVAVAEVNPAMRRSLAHLRSKLARVIFDSGDHGDGLAMFEQAVGEMSSDQGADHPQTLGLRFMFADLLIEAGRLDEGERHAAAVEKAYGKRTTTADKRRMARLKGELLSALALARGKPTQAEALAREALAELTELTTDDGDKWSTMTYLGTSLVERGANAEALALLEKARAIAIAENEREVFLAMIEIQLARAEHGIGKIEEAIARADHAAAVLVRYKGQPVAGRVATAFLARARPRPRDVRSR